MLDTDIFHKFETISLDEMSKVRLMNRIDTKYVTTVHKIEQLLELASDKYRIQQIGGRCAMPYYTCYYDTPDADMFYQHQRGKKTRQKIRRRLYEGGDTPPFIEIKLKNNKGRTNKKRIVMEHGNDLNTYADFIRQYSAYNPEILMPRLENHFYRITLVNKAMTERITIDTGLELHNLTTGRHVTLSEIGIIECKRDGHSNNSQIVEMLRTLRIFPAGFSKYCIGMAVTDPDLRNNRIKPKLRMINTLSPYE